MKIGFIGVGVMGHPMAENLVRSNEYSVTVYDTNPQKMENLVRIGATPAMSIEQAVSGQDFVMTSLPGPKQIEQVAFAGGLLCTMKRGAIWIDLSTNNLDLCQKIAKQALEENIHYLDCPVSGGDEGATAGNLSIFVGGDATVFRRCLPLLQIIGKDIRHLGANGAGYSAKIAQVVLCYLHSLALSEALMLGVKGGVDTQQMLTIIQNSTGKSYVADRYGPPILNGDYDPSFTVGLALKDMGLAAEMAANLGIKLPMCELTTNTYSRAVEQYGFNANHLMAVRLLEEDNNVSLQA